MDISPAASSPRPVAERSESLSLKPVSVAPLELGNAAVTEAAKSQAPQPLPQALKNINAFLKTMSQNLEFTVDPDSDRTIVKVVEQNTGEVIRQLPTKEALEIARALDRMQGLLLRQKA